MKKSTLQLLTLLSISILFFGCSKKDKIPAFLKINEFSLIANPNLSGADGELTDNITDVWVFIDGQSFGSWELPAEVPVLLEGTHTVLLMPGVKNNGISATKGRYLFLESHETSQYFIPNETLEVTPFTFYKTGLTIISEDFEGPTNTFNETGNSPATMSNSLDGAVYGSYCGRVNLNATDSVWNAKTDWSPNLPKGREVYLEIDYAISSNVLISTEAGNAGGANQSPYLELQKSTGTTIPWKKVYVTLQENISYEINSTYNNIILTSILPEGNTEATILIDNVKLLYFP